MSEDEEISEEQEAAEAAADQRASLTLIRRGLWAYFWLLLLEGALRKWFLPQFSDVLFLIRDPLVVLIYVEALRRGVFPFRPAVAVVALLAVVSFVMATIADPPLSVIFFGLRTNYLHLPLVFVMAEVFTHEDVVRVGKWFLVTAVPVAALMFLQFESAPDAVINAGAGGSLSSQITGSLGKIRPPGPFSFIAGTVQYFGLVSVFVFYGWVQRRVYPRRLLWIATAAVVIAVPISISRSMLMAVAIVAVFGLAATTRDLRRIPGFLGPLLAGVAFFAFAADTVYVQAFTTRWNDSLSATGTTFYSGIVLRLLSTFTEPFDLAADAPLFGYGVGMGTMAGARLMTGKFSFLLSESELSRIILELGPVIGFVFIGWRLWLSLSLLGEGWRTLKRDGDALAWLVTAAVFLPVLSGQWGPSTQLGYAMFGSGLALAAQNLPVEPETADGEADETEA